MIWKPLYRKYSIHILIWMLCHQEGRSGSIFTSKISTEFHTAVAYPALGSSRGTVETNFELSYCTDFSKKTSSIKMYVYWHRFTFNLYLQLYTQLYCHSDLMWISRASLCLLEVLKCHMQVLLHADCLIGDWSFVAWGILIIFTF
jgi:hypothetical protein